jgi:hypothetical protein
MVNPYEPPAAPVVLDFREEAVAESERMVQLAGGKPPEELGCSLVLRADYTTADDLRRVARDGVGRLVLGVLMMGGGGGLAAATDYLRARMSSPTELTVGMGVIGILGGLTLLLGNWTLIAAAVRRMLGPRYVRLRQLSVSHRPLCCGVEDSSTFNRLKLTPEDLAWVGFDSSGRRVIIEGLLYRYWIYAADVLELREVQTMWASGVRIRFRVGETTLAITLQMDSIWYELRKRLPWSTHPILGPLQAALAGE